MVNSHYTFVSTGSFKALKGPERHSLTKLQGTVRAAADLIVHSFIFNDLMPYIREYDKALKNRKCIVEPVLSEASCLCQLHAGILGSGNGDVLDTIKDFSVFMKDLGGAAGGLFCSDGESIDAVKSQAWVRKWQDKSGKLVATLHTYEKTLGGGQPDLKDRDSILVAGLTLGPTTD